MVMSYHPAVSRICRTLLPDKVVKKLVLELDNTGGTMPTATATFLVQGDELNQVEEIIQDLSHAQQAPNNPPSGESAQAEENPVLLREAATGPEGCPREVPDSGT